MNNRFKNKPRTASFVVLPSWTVPAERLSAASLIVGIALADLEDTWIRITAAQQRAFLGYPVFGRTAIALESDNTGFIKTFRSLCFGTDGDSQEYSAALIDDAVARRCVLP